MEVRMKCAIIGTVTATNSKDKDWKFFEVRFDGFADLPATKGEEVLSPEFTCFHHKWCLSIHPGGSTKSDDGMVAVFLEHRSRTSIAVDFGLSIRDKEGNRKKDCLVLSEGNKVDDASYGRSPYNFCERSTAIGSLVEGTLIIEARMRRSTTESFNNDGGTKCATNVGNSDMQSSQQSTHKSNKITSADDNSEQPPLKKMRT